MAKQPDGTLYLIDSSIYIFRGWHILPDSITNPQGEAVNALFGFADFLAHVVSSTAATHLVCAFDESLGTSARNCIYPEYKANRPPAPAALKRQFAWCRALVEHAGIQAFSSPQFEADDIIGTLVQTAHQCDYRSCIISADKDLTQFIGCQDQFWDFGKKVRLDAAAIEKKFGVQPTQIADMLAICGDKVDNIPGVPGVGAATAAKLLTKWGTLDSLYENVDAVAQMKFRGAARVCKLLQEHQASVRLARQLTGLLMVAGLPQQMSNLQRQPADANALDDLLRSQGFGDTRRQRLLSVFATAEIQ